jgi:hypothetical protein
MSLGSVLFVSVVIGFLVSSFAGADSGAGGYTGQTVYVPAYSHVYVGEKGHSFNLAVTLIIRNTDLANPITVTSVEYHDSHGKLVKSFLENPRQVAALASVDFFLKESDVTGGLAPTFVVRWKADKPVNEPIMESVMIGARSGQGISFVVRGQSVKEGKD